MSILGILNNTILIPTGGASSPLPKNTAASDLSKVDFEKIQWQASNPMSVFLKVNGSPSQKIIGIQSISELGMSREVESRYSGGNAEYVINLPGPITYSDVTIGHLYSRDKFFLDWMKTGAMSNGVAKADVEIHVTAVNKDGQELVFTLYDAFPTKWAIKELLTTGNPEQVLEEYVTLTFSRVSFALQQPAAN